MREEHVTKAKTVKCNPKSSAGVVWEETPSAEISKSVECNMELWGHNSEMPA